MTNPLIAQFAGQPALLAAGEEERFRACLDAAAAHEAAPVVLGPIQASAGDDFWTELGERWSARLRPYVVSDGVLQIPVKGVLLNNFPYALGTFATGYEYIRRAFERGMDDSNVRGIALIVDSPGGMVAGCFDLVDAMYLRRGGKQVRAFAAEHAYSAAYAIFSVAHHGMVARTGGVGSIGVVTMHVDISQAVEAEGVKVTFIHAGKHKVDGNPFEPLPDAVKGRIQARIDNIYDVFVSTVARNRALDAEAVRATEALTYGARESLSQGLADHIGAPDDRTLAAFAAELSPSEEDEEDMSTNNQDKTAVDQAALDAARAEGRSEAETANAAGVEAARKAERERVAAITGCEEAEGRSSLASHIAMNTEMSVDDAKAMLAAAPVEAAAPPAPGTPFTDAMNREDHPEIGADGGGAEEGVNDDDPVVLARAVGLYGIRPAKTA